VNPAWKTIYHLVKTLGLSLDVVSCGKTSPRPRSLAKPPASGSRRDRVGRPRTAGDVPDSILGFQIIELYICVHPAGSD
jgi:hypothetical protein